MQCIDLVFYKYSVLLFFTNYRKFASGKHLEELVHSSLDKVLELLHKQKEAFDPLDILNLMAYNIIVVMLFGKRYDFTKILF